MIRFVGATKAECDRCPGLKACCLIEREPSGTRETLCLTHTLALISDYMLTLIVIDACVKNGDL